MICKGAPDVIARCCSGSCAVFLKRNESMASRALRVIGVAYKDVPSLPAGGELELSLIHILIVVINAAAGAAQEGRAERAMEALRRMSLSLIHI